MVDTANMAPAPSEAYGLPWLFLTRMFQKFVAAFGVVCLIECRLFMGSGQGHKCPALCTTVLCNNRMGVYPSCPLTALLKSLFLKGSEPRLSLYFAYKHKVFL